ncbi:MAG: copper homeostasis protein CutC [Duganella sp.]
MRSILLEVCVDNLDGLAAALAGGADRLELCAALELGGLTPSTELIELAAVSPLPTVARIRPRAGDFCWSPVEVQMMLNEIDAVAAAGVQGVSLGASLRSGQLDHVTLERLVRRARDHKLTCTLHRAIDITPDLAQATRIAIELGFGRILSSGGAPAAAQGINGLLRCFDAADGRITIMPGAGIDASNIRRLREKLPLTAVHASCSLPVNEGVAVSAGAYAVVRRQTSTGKVAALRRALG